jgi:hypothetical protein
MNNSEYKKLYISSYQGSEASTSQRVKEAFERYRTPLIKLEKENKEQNTILMLFFDEMGLSEHRSNYPLKQFILNLNMIKIYIFSSTSR